MKTNLMNHVLRRLLPAGVCAGLALCVSQAQEKPAETKPKPDAPKAAKPAAVKVPFLGLALAQVDESLAAQIDLPDGVGVLVRAVMPDSPAAKAGVLQHDVLHYFNDQLLVNEPQLQALVRQAGIGTEVTLKLLRKGKAETVSVKLGEHEEREPADPMRLRSREPGEWPPSHFRKYPNFTPPADGRMFNIPLNGDGFANRVRELSERMKHLEGKPEQMREEVERFQREIHGHEQESRAKDAVAKQTEAARRSAEAAREAMSSSRGTSKVWKDDKGGVHVEVTTKDGKAGGGGLGMVTATADPSGKVVVTQANITRMAWNDGDGAGELIVENGKKTLKVKDRDGKEIFSGPVDTEEEQKNLPPNVRERIERMEKNVKAKDRPADQGGELEL